MPGGPFAFSGGVAFTPAYGHKVKVRFGGTWVAGDTWTLRFVSTLSGNFTLGKGNISTQAHTCGFKLRNRVYLGFGNNFALSSIVDPPTLWEEQNAGSAVIEFVSQFGPQNTVTAFSSLQGRLAVIGNQSIQIWQPDADPNLFSLQQTLDNTGTSAPLSVQSIGDLDVLFLEPSGIRSLKAKESTLNAYIDDIGTPIDALVRAAQVGYDVEGACGIVEPTTRQYWLYLNGNIYVLSKYATSNISAWSTYKPTYQSTVAPFSGTYDASGFVVHTGLTVGAVYYWVKGANETSLSMTGLTTLTASGGFVATDTTATVRGTALAAYTGTLYRVDTAFVPEKMVVHDGQVFIRGVDRYIYRYGGSDNNTYDYTRARVETPWLDFKTPTRRKQLNFVAAAFSGKWLIETSMNPRTTALTQVIHKGSDTSPDMEEDSTFDQGTFPANGNGTHCKARATTFSKGAAKLGMITLEHTP